MMGVRRPVAIRPIGARGIGVPAIGGLAWMR
ncbi:hypothetical protein EV148_107139 [Dokdonella fugitiva]|jgi:hypothetical protein|uniref:Uncharacterized protein n=1 Tax=Dokdonella fugitiva TaxID=328517 RepID=A0A4R2I3W4_9GAMM|nr:hypothetical protein [Dokdonella fugitiva]TCO38851.1 hypothetical protein EV148_107139 [Dokdonella fugitiva]